MKRSILDLRNKTLQDVSVDRQWLLKFWEYANELKNSDCKISKEIGINLLANIILMFEP